MTGGSGDDCLDSVDVEEEGRWYLGVRSFSRVGLGSMGGCYTSLGNCLGKEW